MYVSKLTVWMDVGLLWTANTETELFNVELLYIAV